MNKTLITTLSLIAILFTSIHQANAALVIPSNGSDGDLSPTGDLVIDLSEAATADWNVSSPKPTKGVYDTNKWAVVFKYSSVDIPAGKTVSFKNHPSHAPVVWLVSGDVRIAGTV